MDNYMSGTTPEGNLNMLGHDAGADHLITLGQQARAIQTITTSPKARKLAAQAVQCATAAIQSHNERAYDGANLHAGKAAGYLRDAATIHAGTLGNGEVPSPEILDAAHLGGAQQIHHDYVASINEGKNNGR